MHYSKHLYTSISRGYDDFTANSKNIVFNTLYIKITLRQQVD